MVRTRSRNNAAEKMVVRSPKKIPPTKTYLKRKKQQRRQPCEEEHRQMQLQQENEEAHLVTPPRGCVKEAEVENMGGEEVMPLDISSDEEETKPRVDHLSMLKSYKPPSYIETSQENLKTLMDVAAILKYALVSHLDKTVHKLDTADMVRSANKCFAGLKLLKVDYGAFHGEVRKLIKHILELNKATQKNTCSDLGLKIAYEMSVSNVNDAREELTNAEYNLINARTNYNYTIEKIEKLKAILRRLEELAATERDGIENLTSKRDHCNEALLLAERIKEPYEEIQGSLSQLRELV